MLSFLCALAPLFLGAALAAPLYWLLQRSASQVGDTRRPLSAPAILWLTPECQRALGDIAKPGHLARASERCICTRLSAHTFPSGEDSPVAERYRTWPKQAANICAGDYEGLSREQDRLVAQLGEVPTKGEGNTASIRPLLPWFIVFAGLLALSVLFFLLSSGRDWCGCPDAVSTCPACSSPVPNSSPTVESKEVSTDLLFDFNQAEPYSLEHRRRMDAHLQDLFRDFQRIEILGIVAHTDPIGNKARNEALARARGEYMRAAIMRVAQDATLKTHFFQTDIPVEVVKAEGANLGEREVWQQCFRRFYVERLPDRPLEDLRAGLADGRPLCSTAASSGIQDAYPACRRLVASDAHGNAVAYARRAENFRELSACLAPMRHVAIRFKHIRQIVASPQG